MKRRYTFIEVESCLTKIYKSIPNAFVGMDMITGFPGETPEEFEETVRKLEVLPWSRLHVFPYSEREGTPATRLTGGVLTRERQERAQVLLAMSRKRLRKHYENQIRVHDGIFQDILIERPVEMRTPIAGEIGSFWPGYTRNYLRVLLPLTRPGKAYRNTLIRARAVRLIEDPQSQDIAVEVLEITDN